VFSPLTACVSSHTLPQDAAPSASAPRRPASAEQPPEASAGSSASLHRGASEASLASGGSNGEPGSPAPSTRYDVGLGTGGDRYVMDSREHLHLNTHLT
jgi:hypothetical protein